MNLLYYKAPEGNFGDDLNEWLWPKLFPWFPEDRREELFIGIGTILDKRVPKTTNRKVVFGSGVRNLKFAPKLDDSWDIRFVRGPISAQILNLPAEKAISDGALSIALLPSPNIDQGDCIGFLPHYHLLRDYPELARVAAPFNMIDPRWPVEKVLPEIRKCKYLITESLHGAIFADTYRVPWTRVSLYSWQTESPDVSSMKWLDWGLSMGVDSFSHARTLIPRFKRPFLGLKRKLALAICRRRLRRLLLEVSSNAPYTLSRQDTLDHRISQIARVVTQFNRDFAPRQYQNATPAVI